MFSENTPFSYTPELGKTKDGGGGGGGGEGDDGGDHQDQEAPLGSVCRRPVLVGRPHQPTRGPVCAHWLGQSHPPAQGGCRTWWKLSSLGTAEPNALGLQKRLPAGKSPCRHQQEGGGVGLPRWRRPPPRSAFQPAKAWRPRAGLQRPVAENGTSTAPGAAGQPETRAELREHVPRLCGRHVGGTSASGLPDEPHL